MAVLEGAAVFAPLAPNQQRVLRHGLAAAHVADNPDEEHRSNDANHAPLDVHEASMRPPATT